MEPRDGDIHCGEKAKNSKERRSSWSFFNLKPASFKWRKVVPCKDIGGDEDAHPASTISDVKTLDIKKKQVVIDDEQEKPALIDDDWQEKSENDMDIDFFIDLDSAFDEVDLSSEIKETLPVLEHTCEKPSSSNLDVDITNEIFTRFKSFKRFDIVMDCSDHHYATRSVKKPSKDWVKHVQHEWKILESNLPESIFVRVYEERMDLLRAFIIGPSGTPYHDGIFFFDIRFRHDYPHSPPKVHFRSTGLRLNPNLYESGKVCLSILNTWYGSKEEKWNPKMSTILQVLVSIQGLVLNHKPYFNEPAYALKANTSNGEQSSLSYNRKVFLLSCKLMLHSIQHPPKHFEDFVAGHFQQQGNSILTACKAYLKGAPIGCLREVDEMWNANAYKKSCSSKFSSKLGLLIPELIKEFAVKGVDCSGFL